MKSSSGLPAKDASYPIPFRIFTPAALPRRSLEATHMTIDYTSPGAERDDPFKRFDEAEAAPARQPLPPGVYVARTDQGEMVTTSRGADGYRVKFTVIEPPEFAGRTLVRTWTFSDKAIGYTRRDLALFELTSGAKLSAPFPCEFTFTCRLVVAIQRADAGDEFNDIKRITVIAKIPLSAHPYGVDLRATVATPSHDAGAEDPTTGDTTANNAENPK